jgi:serine/threonine protein kinase
MTQTQLNRPEAVKREFTKGKELAGGRFVLIEKLGGGANGQVWKALDKDGHRDVAIKVLLEPGPDELVRLLHEAEKWMRLEHENIVRVYDVRKDEAILVMECLEGGTLEHKMKKAAMDAGGFNAVRACPVGEATKILTDILRGLAFAHDRKILHHDLKPGNILLSKFGIAKISDFGMAREEKDGKFGLSPHLQRPGMSGTPEYMSPEVARGEDASDRQSDIFSAGIVAYQLLTGRHPFSHPSGMISPRQLIAAEQVECVSVHDVQADIPERLADVVTRMLAKDRSKRFKDVADILGQLGDETSGLPCSNCNALNPRGNKYCGNCGSELVARVGPSDDATQEAEASAEDLAAEGYAYARQDNWIRAILLYKQAIKKDPELSKAYANLGYALNHLGKYEEALDAINKGLSIREHPALYAYRAFSNKNLTRYEEAVRDYDKALDLGGTESRNYRGKADCLLELGDEERAYSTVLYALRFDPRSDGLLSLKTRIERARPDLAGG